MSKHTPGPWYVDDTNLPSARPDDPEDYDRTVASRPYWTSISSRVGGWYGLAAVVVRMSGDSKDSVAGRANAKLMAASPDMGRMLLDLYRDEATLLRAGKHERLRAVLEQAGLL